MNTPSIYPIQWQPFTWTLLAVAGIFGLMAILSPRLFSTVSAWSSTWIDIDRFAKKLDKRIDIDPGFTLHSRPLGALTVVAAVVLAGFFVGLEHPAQWIALPSLGLVAATGLVALVSPRLFSRLARWGSFWVDIDKPVNRMNHRVEIDRYVLGHCRLFGGAVLGLAVILATVLIWST